MFAAIATISRSCSSTPSGGAALRLLGVIDLVTWRAATHLGFEIADSAQIGRAHDGAFLGQLLT